MKDVIHPAAIVRAAADLRILASEINAAHAACEDKHRRGLEDARVAGEALIKAKSCLPHGQWLSWLADHVECSRIMAWRYMRVAREWAKCFTMKHLADALKLLTEDADDPEPHPPQGNGTGSVEGAAEAAAGIPPPESEGGHESDPPGDTGEAAEGEEESQPPTPRDRAGHPVPEVLGNTFENAAKFDVPLSLIRQAEKVLDELSTGRGGEQLRRFLQPTGAEGATKNKSEQLNTLKRHLKGTRPYSVCPYCFGEGTTGCKGCSGIGWVSEMTWKMIEQPIQERLAE
jgi:hypothetical protein